ncbi:zinc ABC transporter substrate-binding protein [Salipaludibacillus sp. CUR1]|uniref:metal ABC transporter solute-binding protein, Zn/Mn family n=1 Tax=Salipaludibacillus sp. CUR1 TaxID=2820003 RepID=UPI001E2EB509|nr:zinc ABC transporter substrate-binding protein [Salipaludibacillus sp. CUR1]MCE7794352.1 zinc ABC transporter substrate-binding protein [Salipaludibacillus sp. CUR1]
MFKKLSITFSLMLAGSTFLAACGDNTNEEVNLGNESEENSNAESEAEDIEPVHIMTTLYPIEDFANRIGGDLVEVDNMVPVGADAHTFEPTANQMIEVAEAELFIYNGAGFEGFAESIKDTVESHDVEIVKATDGIELIDYHHDHSHDHDHNDDHGHEDNDHDHNDDHGHEDNDHNHDHNDDHGHEDNDNNHDHNDNHGHEDNDHNHDHNDNHGHEDNDHNHDHNDNHGHEDNDHNHDNNDDHGHDHDHGDEDPHVWLDPIRSIELAENIKNALIEARPDGEEEFTANFEELKAELETLDEEFMEMADNKAKDTIIVSHAGYGYWEDRYSIHQIGIAGISPTNEPSIQQIQEVIAHMEENDINYVMFEQNIPTNIAETVREEADAEDLWLHNLEALTEEDIENGEDYFSLMRQNIEVLETALH